MRYQRIVLRVLVANEKQDRYHFHFFTLLIARAPPFNLYTLLR
jgi:hypothetical protein